MKRKLFFPVILLTVLTWGCIKKTEYLNDEERAMLNAYEQNEKIKFLKNNKDTIVVKVIKKIGYCKDQKTHTRYEWGSFKLVGFSDTYDLSYFNIMSNTIGDYYYISFLGNDLFFDKVILDTIFDNQYYNKLLLFGCSECGYYFRNEKGPIFIAYSGTMYFSLEDGIIYVKMGNETDTTIFKLIE